MNEDNRYQDENVKEAGEKDTTQQEQMSFSAVEEAVEYLNNLQTELQENKTKAEEYYTHLQRLKAEFDNYRKRTQKEKEESAKYASERIILSLLPVLDNFERAIDSSRTNKDFESFSQGIEMILKQFMKVLEDEGLKIIDAVGQEFDPNLHDALLREESDQGDNVILQELQKGYYLKDKVIRPSKVKVSG